MPKCDTSGNFERNIEDITEEANTTKHQS